MISQLGNSVMALIHLLIILIDLIVKQGNTERIFGSKNRELSKAKLTFYLFLKLLASFLYYNPMK